MKRKIPSGALVRLFEQATRAVHSMGHDGGLFPAQWTALRYFAATEDPAQRNAMALARFQNVAFGPVTRTVRTLIAKGHLAQAGSGGRGRTTRLDLTLSGRELLTRDPLRVFVTAMDELSEAEKECLASALEHLVRAGHARGGSTAITAEPEVPKPTRPPRSPGSARPRRRA